MYLGIGLIAIGVIVFLATAIRGIVKDYSPSFFWLLALVAFTILGGVLINQPIDNPDYKVAPYSADTGDGRIFFKSYERIDNDLAVPAYYYVNVSWLNTWEYCDNQITVDVPDGQNLIVVDHTPIPVSRIVGGCK